MTSKSMFADVTLEELIALSDKYDPILKALPFRSNFPQLFRPRPKKEKKAEPNGNWNPSKVAVSEETYDEAEKGSTLLKGVPYAPVSPPSKPFQRVPAKVYARRVAIQKQRVEKVRERVERPRATLDCLSKDHYCLTFDNTATFVEFDRASLETLRQGPVDPLMVQNYLKMLEMGGATKDVYVYPLAFLSTLLSGWEEGARVGEVVNLNLEHTRKLVQPKAALCDTFVMLHERGGHYSAVVGVGMLGTEPGLVYCDCAAMMKGPVVEAVQCFLHSQQAPKRGRQPSKRYLKIKPVQLMLPREVDRDDSPLHLLLCLERLLPSREKELKELYVVANRIKLHLTPLSLVLSLRHRLLQLLLAMASTPSPATRASLLVSFFEESERIVRESLGEEEREGAESVGGVELEKYWLMHGVEEGGRGGPESTYQVQLDLHLHPECNYHRP